MPSESRKSDEDVIEFDLPEAESIVVSASDTIAVPEKGNLRRRRPPFDDMQVSEYSRQGHQDPPGISSEKVLEEDVGTPERAALEEEEEIVILQEENLEQGLKLQEDSESYDSEAETDTGTGEEEEEEEEMMEDESDNSVEELDEDKTWVQFIYKTARLALPYLYMIFISLALAYFLFLIETQQREIHGLQSRISSLENACVSSRRRAADAAAAGASAFTKGGSVKQ